MEPITDTWEELTASHKVMNIWIELAVPKIHLGFVSLISLPSTPSNSANRLWAMESSSLPLLCCLHGEEKGKFWSLQRKSILPSYKHVINHLHNESTLHPESWQCCSCFLDWAGGNAKPTPLPLRVNGDMYWLCVFRALLRYWCFWKNPGLDFVNRSRP